MRANGITNPNMAIEEVTGPGGYEYQNDYAYLMQKYGVDSNVVKQKISDAKVLGDAIMRKLKEDGKEIINPLTKAKMLDLLMLDDWWSLAKSVMP